MSTYIYKNKDLKILVFNKFGYFDRAGYITVFTSNFGKIINIKPNRSQHTMNQGYMIFGSPSVTYSSDSCAIVLD